MNRSGFTPYRALLVGGGIIFALLWLCVVGAIAGMAVHFAMKYW